MAPSADVATHDMGLRDAWAYLALRGVNGALAFVSLGCLTHWLDAAAYGRYALALGLIGAVASIGFQWLGTAMGRYYAVHAAAPQALLITVLRAWCALSAGLLALAWLVHTLGWQTLFSPTDWLLVSMGAPLMGLFNLLLQWANASASPRRYGQLTVLRAGLALGLTTLLLYWPGLPGAWPRETLALASAVVALIVASAVSGIASPSALRPCATVPLGPLARYGLPQAGGFLAIMVLDQGDRFIIQHWHGSASVGGYAAGYDLAQQSMGVLLNVFYLGAFPHLVRLHEQGDQLATQRLYVQTAETVMLVAGLAASIFIVLAPTIAALVFGPGVSSQAALVMPWIAMAIGLGGIKAYVLDLGFQLHKRTRDALLLTALMALLNIGLNLWLVPRHGAIASAWSAVASFGAGAVTSYCWGRRKAQMPALGLKMLKALACMMAALAVGAGLRALSEGWTDFLPARLVAAGAAMATSYLAVAWLVNAADLKQLVRRRLQRVHVEL